MDWHVTYRRAHSPRWNNCDEWWALVDEVVACAQYDPWPPASESILNHDSCWKRESPVDGRGKKNPCVFSKFLLLIPELLQHSAATSKLGAVGTAVWSVGSAQQGQHCRIISLLRGCEQRGLPSAHLLISQTEGNLIAYHFSLLFQVYLRLTNGFQMSLKTISNKTEKEGEAGRWEEIAWALFILWIKAEPTCALYELM